MYTFDKVSHEGNEVRLGTPLGYFNCTMASFRLDCNEQFTGSGPDIFRVLPHWQARLWRQRLTRIPEQLFALLVNAHHRFFWAIIFFVQPQQSIAPSELKVCPSSGLSATNSPTPPHKPDSGLQEGGCHQLRHFRHLLTEPQNSPFPHPCFDTEPFVPVQF